MLLFKKYLELPDYLKTQKCIQKEAKSEILNVNMVKLTAIYTGSRNSDRILILDFITISNRNFDHEVSRDWSRYQNGQIILLQKWLFLAQID